MHSDGARLAEAHPVLTYIALALALASIALLLWYLIRRPPLDGRTKVVLLFGLGVLPISAAMLGNLVSFEHSKARTFCGSCHVMEPWTGDSANPDSESLASRHARNDLFGDENCYACHQDYGMMGTVVTKIGGMRHVWEYYTEYWQYSKEEALDKIHIREPYPNANCMVCHSTKVEGFRRVDSHEGLLEELRSGETGCTGEGCHGPAHPFSKDEDEEMARAAEVRP